jgi:hypothetical protein
VDPADDAQIEEMRAAFFERTRRSVFVLYAALGAAAVAAVAYALGSDALEAAGGLAVGLVAAIVLFAASPLFKVPARAARLLIGVVAVTAGITAELLGGVSLALGAATLWGAFAGFMAGTIIGIARIRKRLEWDDELLLQQKQLGFDPEQPYEWLRSGSTSDQ